MSQIQAPVRRQFSLQATLPPLAQFLRLDWVDHSWRPPHTLLATTRIYASAHVSIARERVPFPDGGEPLDLIRSFAHVGSRPGPDDTSETALDLEHAIDARDPNPVATLKQQILVLLMHEVAGHQRRDDPWDHLVGQIRIADRNGLRARTVRTTGRWLDGTWSLKDVIDLFIAAQSAEADGILPNHRPVIVRT